MIPLVALSEGIVMAILRAILGGGSAERCWLWILRFSDTINVVRDTISDDVQFTCLGLADSTSWQDRKSNLPNSVILFFLMF